MSVHKSCVFAYGLRQDKMDQSQAQTSLPFGFFHIRYIGVPLCVNKIKKKSTFGKLNSLLCW